MVRLANENNAIEEVIFAFNFKVEFEHSKLTELKNSLLEVLKEEFNQIDPITGVHLNFQNGIVNQRSPDLSGVVLQKPGEWSLRIEANTIVLACIKYVTWNGTCAFAESVLDKIFSKFSFGELHEMIFQCRDRFFESSTDYDILNVFNEDNDFLNKQNYKSGIMWHNYSGWFDNDYLNVLNIVSNKKQDEDLQSTSIQHTIRQTKTQSIDLTNKSSYLNVFNFMHECNKRLMKDLLSDAMIEEVGLNDNE